MNFDIAFERLLGHEGGYVDHPSDPGGRTNHGVTERVARVAVLAERVVLVGVEGDGDDRPTRAGDLNPFERGPEITEIR